MGFVEFQTGDFVFEGIRRPPRMAGLAVRIHFREAFLLTVAFLAREGLMEAVQRPARAAFMIEGLLRFARVAVFALVACMAGKTRCMAGFHGAFGWRSGFTGLLGVLLRLLLVASHTGFLAMAVGACEVEALGMIIVKEAHERAVVVRRFIHDTFREGKFRM